MINPAQVDLFGGSDTAPIESARKQKKRDVHAEAKLILEETGISALPREAKEYVLAELIHRWAPELQNVMMLSMIMGMNNQRIEDPAPVHVLQR
jgi:hypothetical protein